MQSMYDPMDFLNEFQDSLNKGSEIDAGALDSESYMRMYERRAHGLWFCYAKIVNRELQVCATFGQEENYKGIARFSVNCAVAPKYRGKGLSISAIKKGSEDITNDLLKQKTNKYYLEALVDQNNIPSIIIAERFFGHKGINNTNDETGTPAFLFYKLIVC